jgi:peptidoglycan/LPS O-acetylase OafA/YrhL
MMHLDPSPWLPADLLTGFAGSSFHLQFAAGMTVAALVARGWVPVPLTMALIGAAGFALTGAAEDTDRIVYLGRIGRLMFGLSATLVVGGLASAERRGRIRCGRVPVLIGAASYSIYLIHVPAMIVLAGPVATARLPSWCAMPLLAAGGVGSGLLLHLLVERPGLALLRDLAAGSASREGEAMRSSIVTYRVRGSGEGGLIHVDGAGPAGHSALPERESGRHDEFHGQGRRHRWRFWADRQ